MRQNEALLEIAQILVRLCLGHDFGIELEDLKEMFDTHRFSSHDYKTLLGFVFDTSDQKNTQLRDMLEDHRAIAETLEAGGII